MYRTCREDQAYPYVHEAYSGQAFKYESDKTVRRSKREKKQGQATFQVRDKRQKGVLCLHLFPAQQRIFSRFRPDGQQRLYGAI